MADLELMPGEKIIKKAGRSFAAKMVFWLAIPFYTLVVYVPTIHLGVVRLILLVMPELKTAFNVIFAIMMTVLVITWVGFCFVATRKSLDGYLILTDSRVLGKQGDHELNEKISDIVDVHIERSLYGKLFNYATVTVVTEGYNITVKNLADGVGFRKALLEAAGIRYFDR